MNLERTVLPALVADTSSALERWRSTRGTVLLSWLVTSLVIGCTLLAATLVVARTAAPTPVVPHATFSGAPNAAAALEVFRRNTLVLLMHALICVAGYLAARSAQIASGDYRGRMRRMHLSAKPVTLAFIVVVTTQSFVLQAWMLGRAAPGVAAAYDLTVASLLLTLSIHALPELIAMFLPLGAWLQLARAHAWNDLFAASLVTTTLALPLLAAASVVEVWVTPLLLGAA